MATGPSNNPQALYNQTSTFRVGGSGFTTFHWQNQVIGYAQAVGVQSPKPVANYTAIQPLDQQYPMQIIVPAAITEGTITLQLFEMYNRKVWDQIMAITDTVYAGSNNANTATTQGGFPAYDDLSQVFLRLSSIGTAITATKIVYPPNSGVRGGPTTKKYADQYYGVTIVDIRDDETIQIGTLEVVKNITCAYTYSRRISETTSNI